MPGTLTWPDFALANATQSATLTIAYDGSAPAVGSNPFTVTATRNTDAADTASGTGTLVVDASGGLTPRRSPSEPLADKHVGDPAFTVSAIGLVLLTVSFAASGSCTIAVDLVHLTGPGTCTITASQAGDSTYAAAPDVARTFTIVPVGASEFDLYAVTGATSSGTALPTGLPSGATTPPTPRSPQPGGPTLVVDEGDTVDDPVAQQLGEHTSLLVQGQGMIPDLTGVGSGRQQDSTSSRRTVRAPTSTRRAC